MADHRTSYELSVKRPRSPSPQQKLSTPHRTRHARQQSHKRKRSEKENLPLPFNSRAISKHDYTYFKPMFALYLDIQKGRVLEDLDEAQAKGRWKSFIGKWNRGELAEGWYDPLTLQKAQTVVTTTTSDSAPNRINSSHRTNLAQPKSSDHRSKIEESDSDDSIGPNLPGQENRRTGKKVGPSIPNSQDLELKREMDADDRLARLDDIRIAQKLHRKEQNIATDELVPKAEAGTRERQLEKKKEVNERMRSFREKSPGAAEVPDSDLMGGGDTESYKKQKHEFDRKKNERELRKEEFLRARQAKREDRMQEYRAKEDTTMIMLKALAKQNFGGGSL